MKQLLIISLEDTPGDSFQVLVEGNYEKYIPRVIEELQKIKKFSDNSEGDETAFTLPKLKVVSSKIKFVGQKDSFPLITTGSVAYNEDLNLIEYVEHDIAYYNKPFRSNLGFTLDLLFSIQDNKLVGYAIWSDIPSSGMTFGHIEEHNTTIAYPFFKKDIQYSMIIYKKNDEILGFNLIRGSDETT